MSDAHGFSRPPDALGWFVTCLTVALLTMVLIVTRGSMETPRPDTPNRPAAPNHQGAYPQPPAQRQVDTALANLAARANQAEADNRELRKLLDDALRRIHELEQVAWAER